MALIEKGADTKIFNLGGQGHYGPLQFSFLMIGLGIEILLGAIIDDLRIMEDGVPYGAMILICGGAGLFYSHVLESKKRKEEKDETV